MVSCAVRDRETESPGSQLFALIVCLSRFIQRSLFHQSLRSKKALVVKSTEIEELLFWTS